MNSHKPQKIYPTKISVQQMSILVQNPEQHQEQVKSVRWGVVYVVGMMCRHQKNQASPCCLMLYLIKYILDKY
jgi:hypothetical protein